MKNLLKIFSVVFLFFASSCSLFDLEDNLENPNEVPVDLLDVNQLMNKIQADFADFIAEANTPGMELTRMAAMIGGDAYERAYQPQDHDDMWDRGYQDVLNQIQILLGRTDGTAFSGHSGAGRVMRAYVLMSLVDLYGDVPYSEALKGLDLNFNPKTDPGKTVYEGALKDLDDALVDLAKTPPAGAGLTRDIYYAGNLTKWAALANTLKLKAWMNLRLTDKAGATTKIAELVTKDLIDTDAEEFTYKYGTAATPARSRHPLYRQMYQPNAGNASGYLGNYFLNAAYKQKGVEDPRWRYYFYRQVGSIDVALNDEPESIPCIISPRPSHYGANQPWCAFDPGFFGRDHGNNDGIPPDGRALTCYGVYPAGGRIDTNNGDVNYQVVSQAGQGANGAGIEPIWMASFTEFLKAEAALMLANDPALAEAAMISGVTKSIARARSFAASKGQTLPAGLEPSESAYLDAVKAAYAAASNKLSVIGKEFYLALWGNGIEAYNLYRRTGMPGDIQPMRAVNGGEFQRSLVYPSVFVNLNSAVQQKPITTQVFWDNNPAGFIK